MPEKPQNQGKIERWHRTFREDRENPALKPMRTDYLEMKLKWDEDQLAESKIKKGKQVKKQKTELLVLAEKHDQSYPAESKPERLACLDTTPKAFKYLCDHLRER